VIIPADRKLRVVGDVHGDARAFSFAAETDRFVIQLGDLTDGGPDSAGTLRLMFRLIDEGRGLFLLGNHDRKLGRVLAGDRVRVGPELDVTLAGLDIALRERALYEVGRAPTWLIRDKWFFVHAAFHTSMLDQAPPPGLGPVTPALSRALFGETTGRVQADGYPERLLRWVNHIPPGFTVYCGHDQRSRDGRPWVAHGDLGGTAVFLDTGSGKGGHLSWIDL
jgi:3',5'-cyclic AMP phosphodiesterase CpdA